MVIEVVDCGGGFFGDLWIEVGYCYVGVGVC